MPWRNIVNMQRKFKPCLDASLLITIYGIISKFFNLGPVMAKYTRYDKTLDGTGPDILNSSLLKTLLSYLMRPSGYAAHMAGQMTNQ